MDSPGAVGRRRGNSRINAEDQALDQIAKEIGADLPSSSSSSKKMRAICYTQPPPEVPARVTTVAPEETATFEAGRSGPWAVEPTIEEICNVPNRRVLDGQSGQWVVNKRENAKKQQKKKQKRAVARVAAKLFKRIRRQIQARSSEEDAMVVVPAASTPKSTPEKVQHAESSRLALVAAPGAPRNPARVRAKKRRLSPNQEKPAVVNDDEPQVLGRDDQVD